MSESKRFFYDKTRKQATGIKLGTFVAGIAVSLSACGASHHKTEPAPSAPVSNSATPQHSKAPTPPPLTKAEQYTQANNYLNKSQQTPPAEIVLKTTITDPAIRRMTILAENYELALQLVGDSGDTPLSQMPAVINGADFITAPQIQMKARQGLAEGLLSTYFSDFIAQEPDSPALVKSELQTLLGSNTAMYEQDTADFSALTAAGQAFGQAAIAGQSTAEFASQLNAAAKNAFDAENKILNEVSNDYAAARSAIPGYQPPITGP